MHISFAKLTIPRSNIYVVGVYDGGVLSPSAQALDERTEGMIARAVASASKFTGKRGQVLEVPGLTGVSIRTAILIGMGKAPSLTRMDFEEMGGKLYARLAAQAEKTIAIALDPIEGSDVQVSNAAVAFASGLRLASYKFDKYQTKSADEGKTKIEKVVVQTARPREATTRFDGQDRVIDGVFFARDLVTEPANIVYPESFVAQCRELEALGVEIEALDERAMEELGMGALLGVGQGSARQSYLLVMKWNGAPKRGRAGTIAVVGKGVTFDTGGISLKPAAGMEDMKFDMGGAATVAGLMKALAGRKAKANVIGVCGLVENMPSHNAQRPGDVVTSMSGQTIEVLNTDAEGRLVLADALWYTQEKYKPKYMIDLATLTGAIMVSLGYEYAGLFSNNDTLARLLSETGEDTGEKVWRMPLHTGYDKMIDSDIADMKNIGGRFAGSITAAQFLQRFVNDTSWAHLDIAAAAWSKKSLPTSPKGATGWGVRLLDKFIAQHIES